MGNFFDCMKAFIDGFTKGLFSGSPIWRWLIIFAVIIIIVEKVLKNATKNINTMNKVGKEAFFCSNCGQKVRISAKFCPVCGTQISGTF